MKRKICPACGGSLGDRWVANRKLQQYCHDCDWKGTPRVPEKQAIKDTKTISVDQFSGFNYQIFDKYGHITTFSRSYYTKEEAAKAMKDDLDNHNKSLDLSPCTAVLWPDRVTVKGEVFK